MVIALDDIFAYLLKNFMSGHSSHGRPLSASGTAATQSEMLETSRNGECTFSHHQLSVKYCKLFALNDKSSGLVFVFFM